MSDVLDVCCTVALSACLDIYAGICTDLGSTRQQCTQHLSSCCTCSNGTSDEYDERQERQESSENEPLIGNEQPSKRPDMTAGSGRSSATRAS